MRSHEGVCQQAPQGNIQHSIQMVGKCEI